MRHLGLVIGDRKRQPRSHARLEHNVEKGSMRGISHGDIERARKDLGLKYRP